MFTTLNLNNEIYALTHTHEW